MKKKIYRVIIEVGMEIKAVDYIEAVQMGRNAANEIKHLLPKDHRVVLDMVYEHKRREKNE